MDAVYEDERPIKVKIEVTIHDIHPYDALQDRDFFYRVAEQMFKGHGQRVTVQITEAK